MSDETPDATGLREAVEALARVLAATCIGQHPSGFCYRDYDRAKAILAAHPTPDASPDPAVVTPDAGDVEALAWCGCARSRWVHPHGDACPDVPDPRRGRHRAVEESEVDRLGEAMYDAGLEEVLGVTDEWLWEIAWALLASDWLASHVAAAREADRAEVERLREAGRAQMLDVCLLSEERRSRAEAAEERLAELVAKIEALATQEEWNVKHGNNVPLRGYHLCEALRAADAATALDAVREKAKAEERERQADRLRKAAASLSSLKHQTERTYGKREGVLLALSYIEEDQRIARRTPEAT